MLPSLFKKLLLLREIKFIDGKFIFMGNLPGAMYPTHTIVQFFGNDILERLSSEKEENVSWIRYLLEDKELQKITKRFYIAGYLQGKGFIEIIKNKNPNLLKDKIYFVKKLLPEFGSIIGYGRSVIDELDSEKITIITLASSPFAEHILSIYGKIKIPVDFFLLGLINKILEGSFMKKYLTFEILCKAKGDKVCRSYTIPQEYLQEIKKLDPTLLDILEKEKIDFEEFKEYGELLKKWIEEGEKIWDSKYKAYYEEVISGKEIV